MNYIQTEAASRVAILIDCDNVSPDILEYALLISAQFGRATIRRGYGNQRTLADKWRDVLVSSAFTPCLQYQYASGKNTADLALALDALEALFDEQADVFCLITSDSDFAYLCRKLRERGAMVYIIGEPKTPSALRNASDQFFEWIREEGVTTRLGDASPEDCKQKIAGAEDIVNDKPNRQQRPIFVVKAVTLLASESADDKVHLGQLGQYLKRTDPAFSPKTYGHTGLLEMLRTYDLLSVHKENTGGWSASLVKTKH
ncbi:NYN domain-containing protein [Castellaniella sp.]|uniref:NYN domain-containing protein n=1 Tax=Castellaniella sp. TaxID=1955812 RepID=UPI002AFE080D|nr:NYN domain-containing protein [Castellaniella sp.]